jgi:GNAT superfamily N-acetyltransferase
MNCQIVHDSIHRRPGWMESFGMDWGGRTVGYGGVAVGGPWADKPTILEFYLVPEQRHRAFVFFEAFVAASGVRHLEIQSSDELAMVMAHTYGRNLESEKIVFRDGGMTDLSAGGAAIRRVTPEEEIQANLERQKGGGEWRLERDGMLLGTGGILFHYNRPYGDLYMEVMEPFRRQGYGAFMIQELKRACYALGAIPGARCNPSNVASRQTLQRAGFVPFCHMVLARLDGA